MNSLDRWWVSASAYLDRLGASEHKQQISQHLKAGRSRSTYRYNPSDYHRDLVEALGRKDEEGFKRIKMLSGYASALAF